MGSGSTAAHERERCSGSAAERRWHSTSCNGGVRTSGGRESERAMRAEGEHQTQRTTVSIQGQQVRHAKREQRSRSSPARIRYTALAAACKLASTRSLPPPLAFSLQPTAHSRQPPAPALHQPACQLIRLRSPCSLACLPSRCSLISALLDSAFVLLSASSSLYPAFRELHTAARTLAQPLRPTSAAAAAAHSSQLSPCRRPRRRASSQQSSA